MVMALEGHISDDKNSDFHLSKEDAHILLQHYKALRCQVLSLQNALQNPPVFFSYSLKNSKNAFHRNEVEQYIGITDPRDVVTRIQQREDIICRADFLEADSRYAHHVFTQRLLGCRSFIAFLSDEYCEDSDLIAQFLYARSLNIRVIQVIVGADRSQGWKWQRSQIGLLIAGQLFIDMTWPETVEDKFSELCRAVEISEAKNLVPANLEGKQFGPQSNFQHNRPVFLSYCWLNSKNAEENGEITTSIGTPDPRSIHMHFHDAGLGTWLDKSELNGKNSMFEDIVRGLLGANVCVACISREYANSENCCLEFVYAVKTLRLPVIPVLVGEPGNEDWRKTKIGLLLGDKEIVDCTEGLNECKLDVLEKQVRDVLNGDSNQQTDLQNLKENDFLELYWPNDQGIHGNLDYGASYNPDMDAIVGWEEGRIKLTVSYWWPVRVLQSQSDGMIMVEWLSYEGEWDMAAPISCLRPSQVSNVGPTTRLSVGDRVQVKLAQLSAYARVDGVILDFCSNGRVHVEIISSVDDLGENNDQTEEDQNVNLSIRSVKVQRPCLFLIAKVEEYIENVHEGR
jgi:hypothetical protein